MDGDDDEMEERTAWGFLLMGGLYLKNIKSTIAVDKIECLDYLFKRNNIKQQPQFLFLLVLCMHRSGPVFYIDATWYFS